MTPVRHVRLLRQRPQPVICEIALQPTASPTPASTAEPLYLVLVRQGRPHAEWHESSPTTQPLPRAEAERLFEHWLAAKLNQGFQPEAPTTPSLATPARAPVDRAHKWLRLLDADGWRLLAPARRSRLVWRIGELRLAGGVPRLVELLETGDAMLDYCIAWAIGRCGDAGALEAMHALSKRGRSDAVKRVARWAWLSLAPAPAREDHAAAVVADWPPALRSTWAQRDTPHFTESLHTALADPATWQRLSRADWLEQLDQVAQAPSHAAQVRPVLLAQARELPLEAGNFRALRHLFKAAEYRGDGELFGLLAFRFEVQRALFHRSPYSDYHYIGARRVKVDQELQQPQSRLAFSNLTRDYLRRRVWRHLRRLGAVDDPQFIALATGYLLACDDAAASESHTRRVFIDGLWQLRHYGPYAKWHAYHRLLHAAHPEVETTRDGRPWYAVVTHAPAGTSLPEPAQPLWPLDAPPPRGDAFPALWDTHPDALLSLLQHARCAGVHAFATRALADNPAYCDTLPAATWAALLQSRYVHTAHFAFKAVSRLLGQALTSSQRVPWMVVLCRSMLPQAHEALLQALSRDPTGYASEPALLVALLTAPAEPVRQQARLLCPLAAHSPRVTDVAVAELLAWLAAADTDIADLGAIAAHIEWALTQAWRHAAEQVPLAAVLALLDHPVPEVQVVAVRWLGSRRDGAGSVPPAVLVRLLQSDDSRLRAVGVELLGMQSDDVLVPQIDLFVGLMTAEPAAVRASASALVARLAAARHAFGESLTAALVDSLFHSEPSEGVHDDVRSLLTGPLQAHAQRLDRHTVWRLLQARSRGAQQLGAALLPHHPIDTFSVREWAIAGRHADASVRQWARTAFERYPHRVRAELATALLVLDTRWDDMREFAAGFFAERCERDDWQPDTLIALCDHTHPVAQRLGRDLVTRHLPLGEAVDSLLRLAQHPSANMQLFVSQWLEQAAAGQPEIIARLEPYFLAVLSQVNRGRVVKDRVFAFLRAQAQAHADVAAVVAPLFARQVLTVAIADKAQYIAGLREIAARHPQLPSPLGIVPVETRAANVKETLA